MFYMHSVWENLNNMLETEQSTFYTGVNIYFGSLVPQRLMSVMQALGWFSWGQLLPWAIRNT